MPNCWTGCEEKTLPVTEELLKIVVCPACKGNLEAEGEALLCLSCRLRYPVRDGIPLLIADSATPLDESERRG